MLQIVDEELVIEIAKEGQPPLSILDLPGLVINPDKPHRQAVDRLVASFLEPGDQDGSYVLPILVSKASEGIAGMRTDLVKGRDFVMVLTHANHLRNDQNKTQHDVVRLMIMSLANV